MTTAAPSATGSRLIYALLAFCGLYGLTSLWTLRSGGIDATTLLVALAVCALVACLANGFGAGPAVSTTIGILCSVAVTIVPRLAPRAWLHVRGEYTTFSTGGAPVQQSVDYRPSVFELVAADRSPLPSLVGFPAPVTLLLIALVVTSLACASRKVPLAVLAVVAQVAAVVLAVRMRSSVAWLPADARGAIQYVEALSGPSVVVHSAMFGVVLSLYVAYRVFVATMPEREAARKDGRPSMLEVLGVVRQMRSAPVERQQPRAAS